MANPFKFEVAIATKDRSSILPVTLLGLLAQKEEGYTLRIYDNGEDQLCTEEPLARAIIQLLSSIRNARTVISFSKIHDQGVLKDQALRECEAGKILFLDDDIYMLPNTIGRCLEGFVANTTDIVPKDLGKIGFTTPSILDYKNVMSYDDYSLRLHHLPSEGYISKNGDAIYKRYSSEGERYHKTELLTGGCCMVDVGIAKKVGGWASTKEWWVDDTVFCRRMVKEGYIGIHCLGAEVYHFPLFYNGFVGGEFRNQLHRVVLSGKLDSIIGGEGK